MVVWRVLQQQSVLALNTWRHGATPHPAPHLALPPPQKAWGGRILALHL